MLYHYGHFHSLLILFTASTAGLRLFLPVSAADALGRPALKYLTLLFLSPRSAHDVATPHKPDDADVDPVAGSLQDSWGQSKILKDLFSNYCPVIVGDASQDLHSISAEEGLHSFTFILCFLDVFSLQLSFKALNRRFCHIRSMNVL